jgi:glycosyltransferase involved in cell wall biosynthesis
MMLLREVSQQKLLVVAESLGVGGTETHLIRTLPHLADSGWRVTVFCLTERGERADELEASHIDVVTAPPLAESKKSSLRYSAHVVVAMHALYGLMRRWRPTIVHFYLPGPYLVGAPVALAARVPIKLMSRRSISDYQRKWPLVARLEEQLHRTMDAVIGNSRAVIRDLIEEGIPNSKLRLIYNGVEVSSTRPERGQARKELHINDNVLVGVMVANLIPYKGHCDLIRSLSYVEPHLSCRWQILLVGKDSGLRSKLETFSAEHGVGHRLHFMGERSDVSRILAAADFGLLTPWGNEGFSNAILEGMAAGLAMIVTDVGGNAEAVLDGETGFVVPPRDSQAIAAAILQIARSPELRARFGAAGRRRVEANFSIERSVKAHLEMYRELVEQKRIELRAGHLS